MIRQTALLAMLRDKLIRKVCRSWYLKLSDGRLVRFVDWRD